MACSGACYDMVETMEYAPYSTGLSIVPHAASTSLLMRIVALAQYLGTI
jgi:hypothetical protein